MITLEDLIVRLQPYPKELKDLCRANPEFAKALKINNPHRFVSLGAVMTSYSPLVPNDQIIGFYTYDYKDNIFKQDFIVNINGEDKEYILYTNLQGKNSTKKVKQLGEFFNKYSQGNYYINSHHPKFEELPDKIKPRALRAIALSKKIKAGLGNLTQEHLEKIDSELRSLGL